MSSSHTAADSGSPGTVLTRTVCVNISGSLANLAMAGPQGGIWKPVEGKGLQVFGLGGDVDSQMATNQLRTAMIHEVNLLEHKSTFPVAMGLHLNCVTPQEITDLGDSYALTVLPHSTISSCQNLYKCDSNDQEGIQVHSCYVLDMCLLCSCYVPVKGFVNFRSGVSLI